MKMYKHSRLKIKSWNKIDYSFWFSFNENNNRSNHLNIGYSSYAPLSLALNIKSGSDNDVTISFRFFIYFYFSFNLPKSWMKKFESQLPKYEYDREIKLAIHDSTIWWNFWTSDSSWSFSTPKYRKGSFNFLDFLLGRYETEITSIEEAQYKIYTDTGINNIILQKELFIKYRNRWYSKWFKDKFFRWNYEYGTIENCIEGDKECYCRLKGTLKFKYQYPKEDYEKIVQNPLKGARKIKWDCDETQGGSFYNKNLKELDEAYLHLVGMIYRDKLKYSKSYYKKHIEQ